MLSAESAVDAATAVNALNVLLTAQIAATAPQSCIALFGGCIPSIAVGPLKLYVASATVQYVG